MAGIFSGFSDTAPFLLQGGTQGALNARLTNIQRDEAALDRGARITAIQLQLQGQMRSHLATAAHDYAAALAQNPAFARQLGESGQLGGYQAAIQSLLKGSVGALSFEEAVNGATPFHDPVYGRAPGTNGADDPGSAGALSPSSASPGGSASPGSDSGSLTALGSQIAGSFPDTHLTAPAAPAAPTAAPTVTPGQPGVPVPPAGSFFGPIQPTGPNPGRPVRFDQNTGEPLAPGGLPVPSPFDRPRGTPNALLGPGTPAAKPVLVNGVTLPPGTVQTSQASPAVTPIPGTNYGKPVVPGTNSAVAEISTLNPNLVPGTNQAIDRFNKLGHTYATSWLPLSPDEWSRFFSGGGAGIQALTLGEKNAVETTEAPANSSSTRNLQDKEAAQAVATTKSISEQLPEVIHRLRNEADLLDAQAKQARKLTSLAPRETASRERDAAAAGLSAQAHRREADVLESRNRYEHYILPGVQNDLAGLADARAHLHITISDKDREGWSAHGGAFPYSGGFSTMGGASFTNYWVNVPAAKRLLGSPNAAERQMGWTALVEALRAQERNRGDIHLPGGGTEYLDREAFPGAKIILNHQQTQFLELSGPMGSPGHNAALRKLQKGYEFLGSMDYSTPPGWAQQGSTPSERAEDTLLPPGAGGG